VACVNCLASSSQDNPLSKESPFRICLDAETITCYQILSPRFVNVSARTLRSVLENPDLGESAIGKEHAKPTLQLAASSRSYAILEL
jgi:hypothetical protein